MRTNASRRELIERLERELAEAPVRYRFKLALLAALGYGVLLAALAMTLGSLVGMLVYLVVARPTLEPSLAIAVIVLGMLGIVVWKAVWIRFDMPQGHLLEAGQAPGLQAEVERIRVAVGARPLHGIVVNADANAAAAFLPQGFALWRPRHVLVLGLPLLEALHRRELATVVAHEFGHFVGKDEKFSAWIYGLRLRWYRLLDGMGQGGGLWGSNLLWLFFRWYAPYFDAYSHALGRRQEYAADAIAASACGAETTAAALIRFERASDWLQGAFWPKVMESAREQSYPPIEVHQRLAERMALELRDDVRLPARLLGGETALDDTHPTLQKRLAALGFDAPLARAVDREPAVTMLGDLADTLRQRFSVEWRAACQEDWALRHRQAMVERALLEELRAYPSRTPEETLQLACLSEDYAPNADPLPLYETAVRALPSSALGHYRLGMHLLKRGEAAVAATHLDRAMTLEAAFADPALRGLESHVAGVGEESPLHATLAALQVRHAARAVDEGTSDDASALLPHELGEAPLRDLARVLRGFDKIRAAWIVRQPLQGNEVLAHYLVLLDWAGSVASETAALPRLLPQLPLPGSCTLLTASRDAMRARQVRIRAGEPAYRRP